jgi:hypothetical protein
VRKLKLERKELVEKRFAGSDAKIGIRRIGTSKNNNKLQKTG